MKFLFPFLFFLYGLSLQSQITYEVDSDQVSFINEFTAGLFSQWTPMNLQFFEPDLARTGTYRSNSVDFVNTGNLDRTFLEMGTLVFQDENQSIFPPSPITRMLLDKTQLSFTNINNFEVLKLFINGTSNDGQFELKDASGNTKIELGVNGVDAGSIRTFGSNGNELVNISTSNGRGYIDVRDTDGLTEAGMRVDNSGLGVIFGDTKSFRVKHPEKSNKEIWYASLEGPEVAAYDRGVAHLQNGEAFIAFKDHFKLIANTKNMTVLLTAHEWDTYGLAVIEKRKDGFVVKELKDGKGNFSFDWEVKCVRVGKEKFEVIRDTDPVFGIAPDLPMNHDDN